MSSEKPRRIVSWAFAINYLVVLLVTCWIPLTTIRATMTNEAGEVQAETVRSIPLYESYYRLVTTFHTAYLQAVLLHWGICLAISVGVWWLVLRREARKATPPDA